MRIHLSDVATRFYRRLITWQIDLLRRWDVKFRDSENAALDAQVDDFRLFYGIANDNPDALFTKIDQVNKGLDEFRLYAAMGQSLALWAEMEGLLVAIAGTLLDAKFSKTGVVLYSITNFNVWLGVIDELFILSPEFLHLKLKWNGVSATLRKLKDTRDKLAHHTTL